uniref:Uncharacterized protein n=1 Tax=Arion vulgaris TaxID=1028688 RepID=A0A0B6YUD4_9EUPU
MFIIVKFGNNESMLVNPRCAVINLLTNIKGRAGFANTNKTIDLSDKNGLIKDLDVHKFENAAKFLTSQETYILVQKERMLKDGDSPLSKTAQYTYMPLLDRYGDLFPNFRIHLAEVQDDRKKQRLRTGPKSPSPAGKLIGRTSKKLDMGTKKNSRRK